MDKETLKSRYFTIDDEHVNEFVYKFTGFWWLYDRKYEYPWASKFVNKNDIVLDAGCGSFAPFKFYLSEKCKKVYACDESENSTNKDLILKDVEFVFGKEAKDKVSDDKYLNIEFNQTSLINLPYMDKMFDKIFSISTIEHIESEKDKIKVLKEFKRVLKDDGLIIITSVTPMLDYNFFINNIDKIGFEFANEYDFTLPCNVLNHEMKYVVYRIVLKNKVDNNNKGKKSNAKQY